MRLMLILLLFFCTACGKDSKNVQEESLQSLKLAIVSALNNKNHENALTLIEKGLVQYPEDDELKYLRSEAYALQANIDVYSLFPLIKMKLFQFAITEWNDVRKISRRQRNNVNDLVIDHSHDNDQENVLLLQMEKIEKIPTEEITYTIAAIEPLYSYYYKNNYFCAYHFVIHSDLFLDPVHDEIFFTYHEEHQAPEASTNDATIFCKERTRMLGNNPLEPKIKSAIQTRIKEEASRQVNDRHSKLDSRKERERYVEALWIIFDSIPVIKNTPDLNPQHLQLISLALVGLQEIKDKFQADHRLGKISHQHILLLSGFLMISSIKHTLYIDKIQRPSDVLCNVNIYNITVSYPSFILGLSYFMKTAKESNLFKLDEESAQEITLLLEKAPPILNDQSTEKVKNVILKVQKDNGC
ncbi:MAG: hypothetical protein HQK52_20895 [Oligoflexia bacterium]|nr:hypothetical protein [Oligoflexia bacterium]